MVKNHLQCRRPQFYSWDGKIPWKSERLPTPVFLGFPGGSAGKESARNAGDLGSVPRLGRSPGEGKGLLQYSGLENSTGCIVHGLQRVGQGSCGAAYVLPKPGPLSGPTVPKSSFYSTPISLHKHLPGGLVDQLEFLRYRKSPEATLAI